MKIQTYTVSKQALTDMPANERDFFLLAGHFANEIIFLSKLATITENSITGDGGSQKVVAKAELVQTIFAYKTLAGKLFEGWQMIQKGYFGTAISKDYHRNLEEDAQEAIKELKRYFNGNNFISKVRNSYAFHYDPEKIEPILNEMDDGDEFDIYIAKQHINSLYYIAESVINKSMLRELGSNDLQGAFDKLHDDIVQVHKLLLTFINNFMKVVVGRYFVRTESNPVSEEIEIGELPSLGDLRLPFFVSSAS